MSALEKELLEAQSLAEMLSLMGGQAGGASAKQSPAPGSFQGHKTKMCQHWQQNKCNYGDACNFSHDCAGGASDRGVFPGVAQAQAQSASSALLGADVFNADLFAALGLSQDGSMSIEQQPRQKYPKTHPCKHWSMYKCNHGEDCGFIHEGDGGFGDRAPWRDPPASGKGGHWAGSEQQGSEAALEEQVEAAVSLLQNPMVQRMLAKNPALSGNSSASSDVLCQAFLLGGCREGSECRFSHDMSSVPTERAGPDTFSSQLGSSSSSSWGARPSTRETSTRDNAETSTREDAARGNYAREFDASLRASSRYSPY